MAKEKDLEKFVSKINNLKKQDKLDLSSDEDLTLAIMNLVSIEEHFFFTANKTGKDSYFDLLNETREIRKSLLKRMIKQYEGEVWCISKHLLAASMRLMEVGTKLQGQGKKADAKDMFVKAYDLYNLFWGLNLGAVGTDNIANISDKALDNKDTSKRGAFGKLGDLVKKAVDCCLE